MKFVKKIMVLLALAVFLSISSCEFLGEVVKAALYPLEGRLVYAREDGVGIGGIELKLTAVDDQDNTATAYTDHGLYEDVTYSVVHESKYSDGYITETTTIEKETVVLYDSEEAGKFTFPSMENGEYWLEAIGATGFYIPKQRVSLTGSFGGDLGEIQAYELEQVAINRSKDGDDVEYAQGISFIAVWNKSKDVDVDIIMKYDASELNAGLSETDFLNDLNNPGNAADRKTMYWDYVDDPETSGNESKPVWADFNWTIHHPDDEDYTNFAGNEGDIKLIYMDVDDKGQGGGPETLTFNGSAQTYTLDTDFMNNAFSKTDAPGLEKFATGNYVYLGYNTVYLNAYSEEDDLSNGTNGAEARVYCFQTESDGSSTDLGYFEVPENTVFERGSICDIYAFLDADGYEWFLVVPRVQLYLTNAAGQAYSDVSDPELNFFRSGGSQSLVVKGNKLR